MSKKQKKGLYRIIVTAILYGIAIYSSHAFALNTWQTMLVYLIPYLLISYDVLIKSVENIFHGEVFDENFLMSLASIGAIALKEYPEALAVMLFYQVGEWFQSYAVDRSRKSIASLMDIRPDYANIEINGKIEEVDPEEVKVGDVIVINPGERVPLDGTVIKGTSFLDTSALTGESVPRSAKELSLIHI